MILQGIIRNKAITNSVAICLLLIWTDIGLSSQIGRSGAAATFYLDTHFGLKSMYKSAAIAANNDSTTVRYAFGGYGGREKTMGYLLKTDTNTTSFLINDTNKGSITTTWQDSIIRYRWGYMYLGIAYTTVTMTMTKETTEHLDLVGTGLGGNIGVIIPFGKSGLFYIDTISVAASTARNGSTTTPSATATYGSRLDIDLGVTLDITSEVLDFAIGYMQRTIPLTVSSLSDSGTEQFFMTYIGFRSSFDF